MIMIQHAFIVSILTHRAENIPYTSHVHYRRSKASSIHTLPCKHSPDHSSRPSNAPHKQDMAIQTQDGFPNEHTLPTIQEMHLSTRQLLPLHHPLNQERYLASAKPPHVDRMNTHSIFNNHTTSAPTVHVGRSVAISIHKARHLRTLMMKKTSAAYLLLR